MVKTPGGQTNLGGLENYVSHGLCCQETIGSGAIGRAKTFGDLALFGVALVKKEQPEQEEAPKMLHQMIN